MFRNLGTYLFLFFILLITSFSQSQQVYEFTVADSTYIVDDPDFELLLASAEGDTSKVKALLSIGAEVNYSQPYEGITPLMFASEKGHLRTVEILIDSGANVNAIPYSGFDALLSACMAGHVYIVDTLILNGANINTQNYNGQTPLIFAAAYGDEIMTDVLLFYKADIDKQDYDGNTPLTYSIFYGNFNIISKLLENEANPDKADDDGFTPLMLAAQNGDKNIMELLLIYGADINESNDKNHSALSLAIINQHEDAVEFLLANGANPSKAITKSVNELTLSEKYGNKEISDLLFQYGATKVSEPFFSKMILAADFQWNFDDIMMGGSISLLESKLGFSAQTGIKTRPWSRSYLYEQDPKTYYLFWETRSLVYIGIDKYFTLSKKSLSSSYGFFVGLNGAYTYGNFRGSSQKPDDKFFAIPKAGFFINYSNLSVRLNYEYMSLDNPFISNHWVNISLGFDINFTKHKVKLKEELMIE